MMASALEELNPSEYYLQQLTLLGAACALALCFDHFVVSQWKIKASGDTEVGQTGGLEGSQVDGRHVSSSGSTGEFPSVSAKKAYTLLSRRYLWVSALVMGADWLQGPYIYALYNSQYHYPSTLIAVLFLAGFLSAGLSAPIIGIYADRYGRKKLCLTFCITYAISCGLILVNWFPILFLGRILGGFSTSILFSAFESWVVSEVKNKFKAGDGGSSAENEGALEAKLLSKLMGRATLVNGLVAVLAGVTSDEAVKFLGTFGAPFMLSAALLALAWIVIQVTWSENYGSTSGAASGTSGNGGSASSLADTIGLKRLGQAWTIVRNDPTLLVLVLTQTCFEGSMYLFVFVWVPLLQEGTSFSEPPNESHGETTLPLGYIFSAFMICMMLGSLLYTAISTWYSTRRSPVVPDATIAGTSSLAPPPLKRATSSSPLKTTSPSLYHRLAPSSTAMVDQVTQVEDTRQPTKAETSSLPSLLLHAKLSSLVTAASSLALALSVRSTTQHERFWAFCLFEGCVGMYYPVQGVLRGMVVSEEYRATLSGLFRVPLNIFVVISLLTGASEARHAVLMASSGILSFASIVMAVVLVARR